LLKRPLPVGFACTPTTANLMGFFYAMNKNQNNQFYRFTNELDEFDQTTFYVHFKLNEFEENSITNLFLHFYDDIYFCQYTGFLLQLKCINKQELSYKIISTREINKMRSLMFLQISTIEDVYGINNRQINIGTFAENWDELLPYTENNNPWDVDVEVEQNNPILKKSNRVTNKYYLYVIKDILTNMHKIGITSKLQKRYKTLLSDRFSLVVEQAYELEDRNTCSLLEKRLHRYFEKHRNVGEWFDLNDFTYTQIQNIILEESLELTEFISEVDISWSYDDRYTIENQHGNGKG
jgi:hypothetical protein